MRLGSVFQQVGQMMTRFITLPVVAGGVASVKMAMDFDTAMRKIRGLVGASTEDMKYYRKAILDLAPAVAVGPTDLAKALYFITSVGFKGKQAMDVLEISAKDSAAGLGEVMTVANALTSAMVAYGRGTMSAAQASDILIATVTKGKMQPELLAQALGRVLSVAHNTGMTFADLGASMAAMSRVGLKPFEAATALRGILMTMLKPSKQTADALASVGLNTKEWLKVLKEEGALVAYQMLLDKTKDHREILAKIIGNTRAYNGFLTIMGGKLSDTREIFDDVNHAVGRTSDAFKAAQGPEFKFRQGLVELQKTAIIIGNDLMPTVLDLMKQLQKLAHWFATLDDESRKSIERMLGIAAVIGPALTLLGIVLRIVGAWKTIQMAKIMSILAKGGGAAEVAGGGAAAAGAGAAEAAAAGGAAGVGGTAAIKVLMTRMFLGLPAAAIAKAAAIGASIGIVWYIQSQRVKPSIAPGGVVARPKYPSGREGPSQAPGETAGPPGIGPVTVPVPGPPGQTWRETAVGLELLRRLTHAHNVAARANTGHRKASLELADAQKNYNWAVKTFGKDAPQADYWHYKLIAAQKKEREAHERAGRAAMVLGSRTRDAGIAASIASQHIMGAKKETDKFREAMKNTPKEFRVHVSTPGADKSLNILKQLGAALGEIGWMPSAASVAAHQGRTPSRAATSTATTGEADVYGTVGPDKPIGDIGDVPIGKLLAGALLAKSMVGVTPYVWGGSSTGGTDCSGLVVQILNAMGLNPNGRFIARDVAGLFPGGQGIITIGTLGSPAHHTGIAILGHWFEAAHSGTMVRGPGTARSDWDNYYHAARAGAIITGPRLVLAGEGKYDEAFIPLPPDWEQGGLGSGRTVHIHIESLTLPGVQDSAQFVADMDAMAETESVGVSETSRASNRYRQLKGYRER